MKAIDRSQWISAQIKALSSGLAARRGLPLILAIGLTIVSLIVHLIAAISASPLVALCGFTLLHVAILIGFIGALLADPLGRG